MKFAVHGITTAAQLLDAHKLIQPDDGWTLFTDKHGLELLPGCIIEVGDTIGIIDNIATVEVQEPISPTIPYCVTDENQGSRPVADRTHEKLRQIAKKIEANRFTSSDIPEYISSSQSAARVWQTVNHGPPIARDEMTFYVNSFAKETGCQSLEVTTGDELFSQRSINAIACGQEQQLMAVLVATHWRILYVHQKNLHWFYSVSSSEDLELHHQLTNIVNQLLPAGYESFTHLGSGVQGWCGWDALEAWIQFRNIKVEPDSEPINPPLHQQVPAQWMTYHDTMTGHPLLSIQELALILRTRWFRGVLSNTVAFKLNDNPLGFGKDDTNMKGKLTGLMISKGHEASESLKIATQICKLQLGSKDVNALMSKKHSVAYPAIQQICKANSIEIQDGEEHAAVSVVVVVVVVVVAAAVVVVVVVAAAAVAAAAAVVCLLLLLLLLLLVVVVVAVVCCWFLLVLLLLMMMMMLLMMLMMMLLLLLLLVLVLVLVLLLVLLVLLLLVVVVCCWCCWCCCCWWWWWWWFVVGCLLLVVGCLLFVVCGCSLLLVDKFKNVCNVTANTR